MQSTSLRRNLKKSRLRVCVLSTALLLISTTTSAASTDITTNCSECHGIDGLGAKPGVPHIDSQPESVLTSMINALQQGTRPTTVKAHRDVTVAEIAPLVKHYAQQKANRQKSTLNHDLAARGEVLYLQRCATCHMDNGRDSAKEAPLMAAQNEDYLLAQMLAFKSGQRKFPFLMDEAYRDLSADDLAAISHFFAAQDPVAPQQGRRRRR